MRSAYNSKGAIKITEDRILRLEAIGFKCSLLKSKKKNTAVVDQECTCNSGEHILSPSDCACDMHIDLDDSEAKELVEAPVEHAVNSSTLVDVNNGLAGVQTAEPVPPSIETSKQVGKRIISFNERIEELKKFKEIHGHCDLSNSSNEYKSLASWSANTRSAFNRKTHNFGCLIYEI